MRGFRADCRASVAKAWGIGGVIMLVLATLAVVWLAQRPVSSGGAEVEAIRFLEQIRMGEIERAWEATSTEFKSFVGRERLRKTVQANTLLQQPLELESKQSVAIGPLSLIECLFRSTHVTETRVRVLLAPTKQGHWQVERLEIQEH